MKMVLGKGRISGSIRGVYEASNALALVKNS
jgi:hypothetical protein